MAFRDLFSKKGRESLDSKFEYEECFNLRRDRLLSFRKNAEHDLILKYPDARMLSNLYDSRFMVLLKNQGRLLVGTFADHYFPYLQPVSEDASVEERQLAVAAFRHEVRSCVGNIASGNETFESLSSWSGYSTMAKSLIEKGYAVTGETNLEYLVGGALFLNGTRIANASLWDPKPRGYFATRLQEDVIQGVQDARDWQTLTFVTVDCNPVMQGEKMLYEIMFNRSLHRTDRASPDGLLKGVVALRDFLNEVEEFFMPDCPLCEEGRLECTPDSYGDDLATVDFSPDESVEGKYPFFPMVSGA